MNNRYSEEIQDKLVQLMIEFLEKHDVHELLELLTSAVAEKEQQ